MHTKTLIKANLQMIELLSSKSSSGDLCISMTRDYLSKGEWGLAKGTLSDTDPAQELLQNIRMRKAEGNINQTAGGVIGLGPLVGIDTTDLLNAIASTVRQLAG